MCHYYIPYTSKRVKKESTFTSYIKLIKDPFMFLSILTVCLNYPAILFLHHLQIVFRLQAGACDGKKLHKVEFITDATYEEVEPMGMEICT